MTRYKKKTIVHIERDVHMLKEKLLEKRPSMFSKRDIVNTFFGSLILGITFSLNGALLKTALSLQLFHILAIFLSTILILTFEIYFIGYTRVVDKRHRPFFEFWIKRFSTFFIVALITSTYLVYLLAINTQVGSTFEVFKVITMLSMPCAVGAAIPGLMKNY